MNHGADDAGVARVGAAVTARRPASGVFIIGLTGSVASGKSTLAGALKTWFERQGDSAVELASTDGFLLANAELEARGLLPRKGYPESYDIESLRRTLADARAGAVTLPGYSHAIYDVDLALARRIEGPGVLIVEGLSLHHAWAGPPLIDCLLYLDADEADLEAWYVERFVQLWAAAEHDPASFYARFRAMDEPALRAFAADVVWRRMNLPNLLENVVLARDIADIVVRKGPGHEITGIDVRRR
jgi:type I pantothenate kinase